MPADSMIELVNKNKNQKKHHIEPHFLGEGLA